MDQSDRYANLDLKEEELIAAGQHVLCAYKMKPKQGYGYLETAAHFAAESSTGTNVSVSTTDDFTRGVDALVYEIDEADELMKIAYPNELFDRNITDGRTMIVSFLTLTIGNNQGMGDVEYAKMHDFYVPPGLMRLYDGPATTISDLWRVLGRPIDDGGFIVGTIIKPKLGLRPKPFAEAAYQFWLGGDFIKNDEPQGNQLFAPMKETIPLVVDAMRRAQGETVFRQHYGRRPLRDHRAGRVHPRNLCGKCRSRRIPDRWLCRWPVCDHDGAATFPRTVSSLSPGRSRCRDLAADAARVHRIRAVEDGAPAGCVGHPYRHDELRQDGR